MGKPSSGLTHLLTRQKLIIILWTVNFIVPALFVFSGRYCFYGDDIFESEDISDGLAKKLIIGVVGQDRGDAETSSFNFLEPVTSPYESYGRNVGLYESKSLQEPAVLHIIQVPLADNAVNSFVFQGASSLSTVCMRTII